MSALPQRLLAGCLALAAVALALLLAFRPDAPGGAREGEGTGAGQGPVGHWVFDRDGVVDRTVKDRAGKLPGAITGEVRLEGPEPTFALQTRYLAAGVSLRDPVKAGDPVLPRRAFTVAAWVRIDEGEKWGGIAGALQDNGDAEKGFLLGYDEGGFTFGLATEGADDGDGKMTYLRGKTRFQKGRWHHVVATYDGAVMMLYVNGKADGLSREQSGAVVYPKACPLVLGAYRDDDEHHPLRGALAEVALYHRAVPMAEVAGQFRARSRLADAPPAVGGHFVVGPYLQYATRDAITVMWETAAPGTSVVRHGVGAPTATTTGPADVTLHEVRLTGLKPGTAYVYEVETVDAAGKALTGPPLTFQAAVDADAAWSFVTVGDTQKNPVVTGKIAALAWARRPNLVLHLGDVVDSGPDKREWTDELFRPCAELFARVPVYPCIGNHEKNHAHYYRYFSLPEPEYHYRYRYGNADFFVLDTNKPVGPGSEQYRWLEGELGRSDATWKVAYHHHPAYSSDEDDYGNTWKGVRSKEGDPNARQLVGLYEKYGVDVVFNGHVHVYERTWPLRGGKVDRAKGVVYVTSGGGGGKLENFSPVPTWFKAQTRSDYHYCYVTVQGKYLALKAFDQQGMLFDSFEISK